MCLDTNNTMEAVELKIHRVRPRAKVWDPCGVQVGSFQG